MKKTTLTVSKSQLILNSALLGAGVPVFRDIILDIFFELNSTGRNEWSPNDHVTWLMRTSLVKMFKSRNFK